MLDKELQRFRRYEKLIKKAYDNNNQKMPLNCPKCAFYQPDFKFRKCLFTRCPYKKDVEIFRHRPLKKDIIPEPEVSNMDV